MPADVLYPDSFQDIKKAPVMQDPINVFTALLAKLLIGLKLLCLLVFDLQLMQPQFYATSAGCIRTFIR